MTDIEMIKAKIAEIEKLDETMIEPDENEPPYFVKNLPSQDLYRITKALAVAVEKMEAMDLALRVPAAEFVPAISDAFTIKDNAISQIREILK